MISRTTITSSISSPRRSAFTLVEVLVVMGIIGLILSIALPITFKARRQASRARAIRDLSVVQTGLEEYKNSFNEYPQTNGNYFLPLATPPKQKDGATVLCEALTGLYWDQPSGSLKPILDPKSGRPRPALINTERFNMKTTPASLVGTSPNILICLRDTNDLPIMYFPGRIPAPDIRANNLFVSTNANSLYNYNDCPLIPPSTTSRYMSNAHMEYILGDGSIARAVGPNGKIDGNDVPSCEAPYLLWAAGPDGKFGLDASNKCDDVMNFAIPAEYNR